MKVTWRSSYWINVGLTFLALSLVLSRSGVLGETAGEDAIDDSAPQGDVIELHGGAIHRWDVVLEEDDFFHLLVEQRGVDVKVALIDTTGRVAREVDSPNGAEGPEELVAIVPHSGSYSIEITTWAAADIEGTVVVHELARRPATAADRELVAADRSYHRLRKQVSISPRDVISGLEPVVELWRSRGLYRREADTLIPLCDAYLATSETRSALAACERAIEWYRAFQAKHLLAPALRRAATAHMHLGELDRAVRRSAEALEISQELGDSSNLTASYQRLGAARRQSGALQAALDTYDEALAEVLNDPLARAEISRERARILLALRRPQEALGALRFAEGTYHQLERLKLVAFTLSSRAEAYIQLGLLTEAEHAARQAVELLVAHDDRRGRAIVLKTLGSVLRHGGNFEGARRAFENALMLFTNVEDSRGQAVMLTELGHLLLRCGDAEGALARHNAALELFQESRDLQGQATSQVRGAQALAALGRLDEAWERLAPALDRIESVRAETARSDFRLAYFAFRREYTGIAVDILMELHARTPEAGWDARALVVNDRGLARELVDAVSRPRTPSVAAPELAEEERALEGRLRSLVAADSFRSHNTAGQQQITAVLSRLHRVRGKIRQAFEQQAPAVAPEVDLAEIQQLLGEQDLLLIYALGETKSYLWSLTDQESHVTTLASRDVIESWAKEFVIALEEDGDLLPGRRLRDLLLAPVAERLRGRQRLIIVADGALHSIPFAALPPPGNERRRYLLEEHEIVMLPSLAALLVQRPPRKGKKWLALFADPVFASDDPRLASGETKPAGLGSDDTVPIALERSLRAMHRGPRSWPLKRLPGTLDEARAIGGLLGAERAHIFTGLEVDRENVLEALSDHRVVHFATHGFSHPRPELSGLVLSLVDETGTSRNGFLQTLEITRLDIAADLVVLSACETARGEEVAGEGILGLAWGFQQAGVARVVASLWQVGDTATARLMTHFYEYLEEGLAPSAALRAAQLVLVAGPRTTPYDWAAFIFQGDWRRPAWPPPGDGQPPGDEQLAQRAGTRG